MPLARSLFVFLVLLAFFPLSAFASGELSFTPGYFFSSKKFDASRVSLLVIEPINTDWTYSSWTGTGRVFLDNPTVPSVRWFSSSHDVAYKLVERVSVAGGAAINYATPSNKTEGEAHMRLTVKLW